MSYRRACARPLFWFQQLYFPSHHPLLLALLQIQSVRHARACGGRNPECTAPLFRFGLPVLERSPVDFAQFGFAHELRQRLPDLVGGTVHEITIRTAVAIEPLNLSEFAFGVLKLLSESVFRLRVFAWRCGRVE